MAKTPGPMDQLTPSLLDRLTDSQTAPFQKLADLRKSVRRDLEMLLNTRWRCVQERDVPEALAGSLVNYGLPDFSGGNHQAAQDPRKVCEAVEESIRRFEPRLCEVHVRLIDETRAVDRTLRFQIEAVLRVEPWEERVRFNSVMEPTTGKVTVNTAEKP
jgi:type VI secretion system protein ImpF